MKGWALDLGTTNTGLAYWDESAERSRLMELPTICRKPGNTNPLTAPRLTKMANRTPLLKQSLWKKGRYKPSLICQSRQATALTLLRV